MEIINSIMSWVMKKRIHDIELFIKYPVEVQKEHEAIYRALAAKNPKKARQAALTHLKNAAMRLGLIILEDK